MANFFFCSVNLNKMFSETLLQPLLNFVNDVQRYNNPSSIFDTNDISVVVVWKINNSRALRSITKLLLLTCGKKTTCVLILLFLTGKKVNYMPPELSTINLVLPLVKIKLPCFPKSRKKKWVWDSQAQNGRWIQTLK